MQPLKKQDTCAYVQSTNLLQTKAAIAVITKPTSGVTKIFGTTKISGITQISIW